MDAVKFILETERMCKAYKVCSGCPIYEQSGETTGCHAWEIKHPKEAVAIVEKWSKEYPQKTILDDLLEKHPNAVLKEDNLPVVCAHDLGYVRCNWHDDDSCKRCWNTPYKEV